MDFQCPFRGKPCNSPAATPILVRDLFVGDVAQLPICSREQAGQKLPSAVFSCVHINRTPRNWTTVGIPGLAAYPIVDPRGLVTPLHDGWSLDFWILTPEGRGRMFPSKLETAHQRLIPGEPLLVETRLEH